MNHTFVCITCIELENVRNVGYGKIDLINPNRPDGPNILGVYGPNGSGKTTLIAALSVLRYALSGRQLPADYAEYINIDTDHARLVFHFRIRDRVSDTSYNAIYEFKLSKIANEECL